MISIPSIRFSYHSLRVQPLALLTDSQQLVLDHLTRYSLVIDWHEQQIISATTFTEEEFAIVYCLVVDWPSFTIYERLFSINPSAIDDARATGALPQLLAPLDQMMKMCRTKLQALGLDIHEIDRYGYRLAKQREPHQERASQ